MTDKANLERKIEEIDRKVNELYKLYLYNKLYNEIKSLKNNINNFIKDKEWIEEKESVKSYYCGKLDKLVRIIKDIHSLILALK